MLYTVNTPHRGTLTLEQTAPGVWSWRSDQGARVSPFYRSAQDAQRFARLVTRTV